ncbi:hypothetical protein LXL04_021027 [Taraxacum kok-saghyz]
MAANILLGLAANSNPVNFQIPSLSIKLNQNNFSLWRSTIISALETFDLESFVLSSDPPAATISVPSAAGTKGPPTIEANPALVSWKKKDRYCLRQMFA